MPFQQSLKLPLLTGEGWRLSLGVPWFKEQSESCKASFTDVAEWLVHSITQEQLQIGMASRLFRSGTPAVLVNKPFAWIGSTFHAHTHITVAYIPSNRKSWIEKQEL